MDDQTKVTRWLIEHKEATGAKFTELSWPRKYGLNCFDFSVELDGDRGVAAGRGTDAVEELALEKAASEAIERLLCKYSNLSSVGVAAHISDFLAREHARLEAVERFGFNWHIDHRIPFDHLEGDSTSTFFRMSGPFTCGVVCLLNEQGTSFLGLAYDANEARAKEKSFFEAFRNIAAFDADPAQFMLDVESNPDLWCCNTKIIKTMLDLFRGSASDAATWPVFEIESEPLTLSAIPSFADCPLFVHRARVRAVS